MLKLLIVDDEVQVRDGLEKLFDWENIGYTVIGKASDGTEALEKFKIHLPDVVITDICMSNMDGLSLLTKLKELNPHVEIIILTAYPQFDFAKRAISDGAFAYLLKPLNASELSETMDKAKDKVLKTKQRINEVFLRNLLQRTHITEEETAALCNDHSFFVPLNQIFFVVTAQLDTSAPDKQYKLYETFCELLSKHMLGQYNIVWCHNQEKCVSLMAYCHNNTIKVALCNLLNEIKDEFTSITGESLTLGISNTVKSMTQIADAYRQSLFAVSQKAIYGYGQVVRYNDDMQSVPEENLNTMLFLTKNDIESISNGILTHNRKLTDSTIKNYFTKIRDSKKLDIQIIKNIVSELAIQIIHFSAPDASTAKIIYGRIPKPIAEIGKLGLLSEMEEYIATLTDAIFLRPNILSSQHSSKLIRDAEVYMMLHYPLPITVTSIANELHISAQHLMRMFKQETGKTINEYLTDCRMNAAINLLESGNYLVSEISNNVGYADPKYFCKVFKRITGYSPSDYMKK